MAWGFVNIGGAASSGDAVKRERAAFDTAGNHTWTCPDGVKQIDVMLVGGGEGGTKASGSGNDRGGFGGEAVLRWGIEVTPGETYDITIGAGGAAGNGLSGKAGGNTTAFGLTARGGDSATYMGAWGGTHGGSGSNSDPGPQPGQHGMYNPYDGWYYGCGGGGSRWSSYKSYPGGLHYQTRGRGGDGALYSATPATNGQPGGGGGGAGIAGQASCTAGAGGCGIVLIYY